MYIILMYMSLYISIRQHVINVVDIFEESDLKVLYEIYLLFKMFYLFLG